MKRTGPFDRLRNPWKLIMFALRRNIPLKKGRAYGKALSVNIQFVTPSETADVCCWQCGEKGHYKRECPHKPYQCQRTGKNVSSSLDKKEVKNQGN